MAIDWITTLQEQADFATQIAEEVKQTLKLPDLTATQAARLIVSSRKALKPLIVLSMKWSNTIWITVSPRQLTRSRTYGPVFRSLLQTGYAL